MEFPAFSCAQRMSRPSWPFGPSNSTLTPIESTYRSGRPWRRLSSKPPSRIPPLHVGSDEVHGAVDGANHVGLGGEMDHRIRPRLPKDLATRPHYLECRFSAAFPVVLFRDEISVRVHYPCDIEDIV